MSVLWQLTEIFLLGSCAHSMAKNSVGFTEGLSYSRVTYLASLLITSYMVLFTFISLNICLPQHELYLFLTGGGCNIAVQLL